MDICLFYYDPEELCKSRRILTPRLLDLYNSSENTQPHLIIAIYFTATMAGQVLFLSNRFVPAWKQVLGSRIGMEKGELACRPVFQAHALV